MSNNWAWKNNKRGLNGRQKHFLATILERGYYVALKLSGYSKHYGFALLGHPKAREYQLSLLTDAMGDISMTLADLIKARHKIATDLDTPPKIADEILKDLIGYFKETGESVQSTQLRLKPAIEIKDAEVVNEKSNEEKTAIKEHSQENLTAKADNGPGTENISPGA